MIETTPIPPRPAAPPQPQPLELREKTYKRELASLMMFGLWGFFLWGLFSPQAADAARFLALPVFTFAGGAFGMDAWAKQVK